MTGDNVDLERSLLLNTEADVLESVALLIRTHQTPEAAAAAVQALAEDCRTRAKELRDQAHAAIEARRQDLVRRMIPVLWPEEPAPPWRPSRLPVVHRQEIARRLRERDRPPRTWRDRARRWWRGGL